MLLKFKKKKVQKISNFKTLKNVTISQKEKEKATGIEYGTENMDMRAKKTIPLNIQNIYCIYTVHHQVFCTSKMSKIAQKSTDDKKLVILTKKVETHEFHFKL